MNNIQSKLAAMILTVLFIGICIETVHADFNTLDDYDSRPGSRDTDLLKWSTYLGSSDMEQGTALAYDLSGNVYVAGWTYSTSFPTTSGAYDRSHNGGEDIFVSKISSDGTNLLWSTFIGGSLDDGVTSVDVDSNGDLLVIGYSYSSDFPTTVGCYDSSHNGLRDVVIIKLKSDGTSLRYSSYFGGSDNDNLRGRLGSSNEIYLSGTAISTDFPTTANAYDREHNGGSEDVIVAKFSADGKTLFFSTFLGGSGSDECYCIPAINKDGNIYAGGYTDSFDFPVMTGCYQSSKAGFSDWFLFALSSDGQTLVASTYLGGSDLDHGGRAPIIDLDGNLVVSGYSASPDFPITSGSYDTTYNGGWDGIITILDPDLENLLFSTFVGGTDEDSITDMKLDSIGRIYLTGYTTSSDFPLENDPYDPSHNGDRDAFLLRFSADCTILLDTTYLGGSFFDEGAKIDLDYQNYIVLTGRVESSDFPCPSLCYDSTHNGDRDAYVLKFKFPDEADIIPPVANAGQDQTVDEGTIVTLNGSLSSDDTGIAKYTWSFFDIDQRTLDGATPSFRFNNPGHFEVILEVSDTAGNTDIDIVNIVVNAITRPNTHAGSNIHVAQGTLVEFNGSLSTDNVGIVDYIWTFTDGSLITLKGMVQSYRFNNLGTFLVTLNVTDSIGLWDTDTMTVTVMDMIDPIADAGLDQTVYEGSAVTFDGSGSWDDIEIVNYTWHVDWDWTNPLYGISPSYTFEYPGEYEVSLEVWDEAGNYDGLDTMNVTVIEKPAWMYYNIIDKHYSDIKNDDYCYYYKTSNQKVVDSCGVKGKSPFADILFLDGVYNNLTGQFKITIGCNDDIRASFEETRDAYNKYMQYHIAFVAKEFKHPDSFMNPQDHHEGNFPLYHYDGLSPLVLSIEYKYGDVRGCVFFNVIGSVPSLIFELDGKNASFTFLLSDLRAVGVRPGFELYGIVLESISSLSLKDSMHKITWDCIGSGSTDAPDDFNTTRWDELFGSLMFGNGHIVDMEKDDFTYTYNYPGTASGVVWDKYGVKGKYPEADIDNLDIIYDSSKDNYTLTMNFSVDTLFGTKKEGIDTLYLFLIVDKDYIPNKKAVEGIEQNLLKFGKSFTEMIYIVENTFILIMVQEYSFGYVEINWLGADLTDKALPTCSSEGKGLSISINRKLLEAIRFKQSIYGDEAGYSDEFGFIGACLRQEKISGGMRNGYHLSWDTAGDEHIDSPAEFNRNEWEEQYELNIIEEDNNGHFLKALIVFSFFIGIPACVAAILIIRKKRNKREDKNKNGEMDKKGPDDIEKPLESATIMKSEITNLSSSNLGSISSNVDTKSPYYQGLNEGLSEEQKRADYERMYGNLNGSNIGYLDSKSTIDDIFSSNDKEGRT